MENTPWKKDLERPQPQGPGVRTQKQAWILSLDVRLGSSGFGLTGLGLGLLG